MLLVPLGEKNTVMTSGSLCLLVTGGECKSPLCEASEGSSGEESGRSYSYLPFLQQENTSFYFIFLRNRRRLSIILVKAVKYFYYNNTQRNELQRHSILSI